MRESVTVYAWTTLPSVTVYAWTTWLIHSLRWTALQTLQRLKRSAELGFWSSGVTVYA